MRLRLSLDGASLPANQRAVVSTACALCFSGCAALTVPAPIIENRFRAELPAQPDNPQHVTIDVATGPTPDTAAGVPITQLSDRGQAALIEQTKGKPPVAIKQSVPANEIAIAVHDRISRHMVVSIRPATFLSPGDRIDAIKVRLEIGPGQAGGWQITSWTQASNGETTIDVGKATDVNSSKLTATTGTGAISALPNASIGGEVARGDTREANIKDATDFDAAVDGQGHAWLDETAGWRIGLSHNLSMDAEATAAPPLQRWSVDSTSSLTRDDPKHPGMVIPQSPDQVRLNPIDLFVPQAEGQPLCGRATLEYRIRHIANEAGRATFSESDDIVQPLEGEADTSFLFAPAPLTTIPKYGINIYNKELSYKQPGNSPRAITFTDLAAATAFKDWLVQVKLRDGRLANARLGIASGPNLNDDVRPLTNDERKSASVWVSNQNDLDEAWKASSGACRQQN